MSRNLIDRDELNKSIKLVRDYIDKLHQNASWAEGSRRYHAMRDTVDDIVRIINNAPIVDAVVHGEWIEADDFYELMKGSVVCSNCGGQYQSLIMRPNEIEMRANKTPYCPNCGAKMDGEVKDP